MTDRLSGHYRLADVIGHRGVPARAPENSLAGVRCAFEAGFLWVELDVQTTADHQAVVVHDFSLPDIGRIAARGMKQIEKANVRLPLLDDILALVCELGIGLVLEIKARFSTARRTAAVVHGLLQQDDRKN